MRTVDVFFYGLFMDEELLRARGVTVKDIRHATVPGFQLRIGQRASLVPSLSGRVYGIIASISQIDIERLYSEPGVQDYRPEAVLAHLTNGETLAALCFNLVEPPSIGDRNPEYASRLRDLAERLHFPAEYVKSIV